MRNTPFPCLRRRAGRSLLVALIACNATLLTLVARADVPATRPAGDVSSANPQAVVDIRTSLEYLASDELEGRGAGTHGLDLAADFIAGKFDKLKLAPPPGWADHFQQFTITTSTTVDPKTNMAAGEGTNWTEKFEKGLRIEKEYQPLSFSTEGKFDAPVVFAGYAITAKHHGYDDFDGLDVKGKVVLAMRFEPVDKDGKSVFTGKKEDWSGNASIPTKAKLATDAGAVALILVNPPNWQEQDNITPFARDAQFMRAAIPVIQVKEPVADAMLVASGLGTLSEVQKKIDSETKPHSAAMPKVSVKGEVVFNRKQTTIKNVAAVLPGTGAHKDEWIVIGSHYDHLGRGGVGSLAPFSKEIHHGADDNASGTTAMMKLAEDLSKMGPQDRSILFVAFTGEELGLLGSNHFVSQPPMPLEKIAAMINCDMVGRVKDNQLQVGGSGTAESFEKLLKEANEGTGLKLSLNSKGGMGPSDHMSFAMKKVPVLFFFSGLHKDYHRPTDTADKINYEGIEQVVSLGKRMAIALAGSPREQYVAKYDKQGMGAMMSGSGVGSGGPRATLGVIPDYTDDTIKGVRISGTTPGTGAEKCGLQAGDTIVGLNDKPLANLNELSVFLMKAKPGDKVKLKVQRKEKEIDLETTLTERKG